MIMKNESKTYPFDVVKAVKDASRTHIGTLPLGQVVPNKKKKQPKHKLPLTKLMVEE